MYATVIDFLLVVYLNEKSLRYIVNFRISSDLVATLYGNSNTNFIKIENCLYFTFEHQPKTNTISSQPIKTIIPHISNKLIQSTVMRYTMYEHLLDTKNK